MKGSSHVMATDLGERSSEPHGSVLSDDVTSSFRTASTRGTTTIEIASSNPDDLRRELQYEAALSIQTCWRSYRDRKMFFNLRSAISGMESALAKHVLEALVPTEASLLKDPTVNPVIRFRLAGPKFPPSVVFKIFYRQEGRSCRVQYFSGKKLIAPASQAAADACREMGARRFLDQMREDAVENESQGFIAQHNPSWLIESLKESAKGSHNAASWSSFANYIVKEYVKRMHAEDESSAHRGGRDNGWRPFSNDVFQFQRAVKGKGGAYSLAALFPLGSTHLLRDFTDEQLSAKPKVSSPSRKGPSCLREQVSDRQPLPGVKKKPPAKSGTGPLSKKARLKRMHQMREAYGFAQKSPDQNAQEADSSQIDDPVPSDEEADALVAWSQQLDVQESDEEP